jgi:hypothetical protein
MKTSLLVLVIIFGFGSLNNAFANGCSNPQPDGWFTCCDQSLTGDHPICNQCHYNNQDTIECKTGISEDEELSQPSYPMQRPEQ